MTEVSVDSGLLKQVAVNEQVYIKKDLSIWLNQEMHQSGDQKLSTLIKLQMVIMMMIRNLKMWMILKT